MKRFWNNRLYRGNESERGSASIAFVMIVLTLVVVIGLVVDGAGKIQANERAGQVAASAARAATNSVSGETVLSGALALNRDAAQAAALAYVDAAGMTGTVTFDGEIVNVAVATEYATKFVSLIGITSLPGGGQASAQLITE
ncbi:hypothetical protein D6T64_21580 [Cryobacterium melibiosiphilum]|uniref:Putative Flp pilus-assembly TadG-like N-terminal domain-containing protein n=1 Tax=Cryobacterium melibiosiphilum TaxID=995039 RepID=A0A3A5MBR0_9MICO|nr:pilus assembly protein TadG-related protein [Cryobacterium melibiosiphilum]RJT84739.1 hypothetical protein D6T64_21580 [Cryobacterium melibiosiphilum]